MSRKPSPAPVVTKAELRLRLPERIGELGAEQARRASQRAGARVLALPELLAARGVLVCLSFGTELDTWPLVEKLLAAGHEVYVPRADPRDRMLHLHRYPCALETLTFGLQQPRRDAPELAEPDIDAAIGIALVLGLGFDRRGYRLGYGKGYFDRFLARHAVRAVGLAYDAQIVERIPEEPHDVPMASVVTESAVHRGSEGRHG